MSSRRGVAILGSTGSVGTAALRVLERHVDAFDVVALTAYENKTLLREQARQFNPTFVGCVNGAGSGTNESESWKSGIDCLTEAATHPDADIVINAVVGAAGLHATLAALEAGKRVALANKESLVMGGELVFRACQRGGGEIVPVDSEHSAILQCIAGRPAASVQRVILTASGGPFRGWSMDQLQHVTVRDALKHPTWSMGRKITIDSATLANKALEVIEAHYLFGISYDRIEAVVHPQSLVHSFVEFVDRSVVAQVGVPSMELPILYALTHPERLPDTGVTAFDPIANSPMTFEPVNELSFPALGLGVEAGKRGGAAPAIFNAANEQAVAMFLDGKISFLAIPRVIESALGALSGLPSETLDQLLSADQQARDHVRTIS